MSNETSGETSTLVVNEEHKTRIPSLRGLKQGFFGAAGVGALVAIVPTVVGMINGNIEVYPSVLTAAFAGVSLAAAAVGYVLEDKKKSSCASNILLIGLQGFATATAEIASISGLMQTPSAYTGMAVAGTAIMNGVVVASGALGCAR